jgi:hypothetical protein
VGSEIFPVYTDKLRVIRKNNYKESLKKKKLL